MSKKAETTSIKQMITDAVYHAGVSQAELARTLGTSPANLNKKVNRNTLTKEDLEQIAEALGAKYVCFFEFPDGTRV